MVSRDVFGDDGICTNHGMVADIIFAEYFGT